MNVFRFDDILWFINNQFENHGRFIGQMEQVYTQHNRRKTYNMRKMHVQAFRGYSTGFRHFDRLRRRGTSAPKVRRQIFFVSISNLVRLLVNGPTSFRVTVSHRGRKP